MGIKIIRVADLTRYISKPGVFVVDIRDRHDFAAFHIEGARHVPIDRLEEFVKKHGTNPLFILCCHKGVASVRECKKLYRLGYRVGTVAGGMNAYRNYIDSLK